ncbi:hypothetical protein IMZ48_37260 [Candidatus Bathyarchaeota archaeon]|nr:hypothetical protein [Candidatus Bathyarchaeota archaeon]
MDSVNGSENEHIDVVTPPTVTKKSRAAPKATTPKATPAGDGDAEKDSGNFSKTEMMLLIEMISTLGESANGIKFNWAAVSEKLGLPSAGATSVFPHPIPLPSRFQLPYFMDIPLLNLPLHQCQARRAPAQAIRPEDVGHHRRRQGPHPEEGRRRSHHARFEAQDWRHRRGWS